ncbi:hypothetical protein M2347_003074 [Chryseobacterium sp. H1D6B]|uniref:glycogen-binding domain-containing protein n=1 Tax=Chryseobacterium sp. H1D6B TaxID=2940588 RepID=UPI0015C7ECDC|nr:glycogen-binding domain-containing protein [Chryseobacterium sp. H1D6B]MDH6253347.1 hypothetical protein [Chryseobacterium sp. H1D6B]
MNAIRPAIYIVIFFMFYPASMFKACTIFMANDGKNVWIGNNEDESSDMKYRFWYFPRENKAFGYMLWSEKHDGYDALMWQYPQGGLNEFGLFMDYTAIDEIPVTIDPLKKTREQEVVNDILKTCKTVKEALAFIKQFNLVKLSGAQLFIGDATGDYAAVHGNYVVEKTDRNFSLTNYCIADGHKEACWRRETAGLKLTAFKSFNSYNISGILKETAQKWPGDVVTNYSMAVNLKKQEMTLYLKNDFKTPKIINLSEKLKKGKHSNDISDYFPVGLAKILKEEYEKKGISGTVTLYSELREKQFEAYNFNNGDALQFAINLISENKIEEAIQFLSILKKYEPDSKDINDWMGIANKYNKNALLGNSYFDKVLTKYSDDYLATLFYKKKDHKVIFKINEWSGAQNVKLIGDFTGWLKEPIKMEKKEGYWYCEVSIPDGTYKYKFLVDDVYYLPDPINLMYIWKGDNINSVLYL